ncbi:hypothetical protein APHAL10511_000513 [Amanita phalloides]|nr:hypothetical protein APHAL10511_000513 [Amanita phalloides]
MKKKSKVDETFSSSEHQFQPREDDDETLWEVIAIIGEKKGYYRVKWAGLDDAGKPWAPSWVPKGDVTADLVKQWKIQKAERDAVAAAARSKKAGKRGSTSSTTRTASSSRTGSTRTSRSTARTSSPVKSTSAGASGSRSVRFGLPIIVEDQEVQLDESGDNLPALKHRTKQKRKRESLLDSDSSDISLPSIVTLNEFKDDTSPVRPLKKRKVSVSEEQSAIAELANANGRVIRNGKEVGRKAIVFEESSDDGVTGRISSRTAKPQIREAEKTKNNSALVVKRTRNKKDVSRELFAFGTDVETSEDDARRAISSNTPKPQTRQADTIYVKRPTEQGDSQMPVTPLNRIDLRDVVREHSKCSTPDEAVTHKSGKKSLTHNTTPPRNGQRSYNEESRKLSPTGLERLKQHDADMEAVERAGQEEEAEEAEYLGGWIDYNELSPPYYHPPDTPPLPSSSLHPPQSQEASELRAAPKSGSDPAPPRSPSSKTKFPSKSFDDSYLQGIVPETEPEDSSGNTQSQDLSTSESQPVPATGSHPSMLVEPPASLRSPAPDKPQNSSSQPSDLELPPISSLGGINEEFQSTSQDADISAPLDGTEPERESREDRSPIRGKVNGKTKAAAPPHLLAKEAGLRPSVNGEDRENSLEAEDLVSSIEQFSSPEKRTEANLKSADHRNAGDKMKRPRMPSPESGAIQRRGMELANASRQAALQSRSQVRKKSLTEIIKTRRSTHKGEGVMKTGVPLFAARTPSSSIQDLSNSFIVPNSLPDVPEEVVDEMERAYVDLNGGSNDDTIEDSTPVQRCVDGRESTEVSVRALRQEEEESTQDLLQEARGAIEQAEGVVESTAVEMVECPREEKRTNPVMGQDASNTHQSNEAQPALTTRSDQVGQPDALLQQAQAQNQELQNEIALLRRELEVAAGNSGLDKPLEQQLAESKAAYEQDRTSWDAERGSLTTAVQEMTRAKEAALKEIDFVKGLYDRASNFAASTSRENRELEERAKIAEGQAKIGVAMIKATLENRVKELENHVDKWQTMATFLIHKDQRTDNDELRQRAAEHPELEAKCQSLEEEVGLLRAQLENGTEERDKTAIVMGYWKQEVERLSTMLDKSRAEVERLTQVSPSYEMVHRCLWRTEENQLCDGVFQTLEELMVHFNSTGHHI